MRQEVIVGIIENQSAIDASIAVVNNEAISIKEIADNIMNPIDNIKTDIGNIKPNISNIKNDIETIKTNSKTIRDDINDMNSDIINQKSDIGTCETDIVSVKSDLINIREEVSSNKNKVSLMNDSTVVNIENTLNTLEGKLNTVYNDMPTSELQDEILKIIENKAPDTYKRYGVRIKKSEPNPYTRVEYTYDAIGMKPAKMNYHTGKFEYGDWRNLWFVKNNYPCMLKYDGTVDYKLNPNDYTKKEDGTVSDVNNENYAGNAMSRFPLIWTQFKEDDEYEYITVCEEQYDETYLPIGFVNDYGVVKSEMFVGMFEGCNVGSVKRSLYNKHIEINESILSAHQYAIANGSGWYPRTWAQRTLINALLTIISKSDDGQSSFGNGIIYIYNSNDITGNLYNKGQFYGFNDENHCMKVFHIENWWGNYSDLITGINIYGFSSSFNYVFKMHGPYVLPDSDIFINDLVSYGYTIGPTPPYLNGYIVESYSEIFGRLPKNCDNYGSDTTYQCDTYKSGRNIRFSYPAVGNSEYLSTPGPYTIDFSHSAEEDALQPYSYTSLSFIDPTV